MQKSTNSLSVCLIVRDEEPTLARCLSCVSKFADEIVVVDTGSVDCSVQIAKRYTNKVFDFEWTDDFSAARNFSLCKATCDYVMWLDADDVISDADCLAIRKLVNDGGFDMAFLPYATAFDGGEPTFCYYRERIFSAKKGYRFCGAVHEAVPPEGKIVYSNARIDHKKVKEADPKRNLRIYQKMQKRGVRLEGRDKFYYGRELMFNGLYREAVKTFTGFIGGDGWEENKAQACLDMYDCFTALGDGQKAFDALIKSLCYSRPKARFCCLMGEKFMFEGRLKTSVYWYERALECKFEYLGGGFFNPDHAGFVPYMQLGVLYDRLGDVKTADMYNEMAGKIKPNDKGYLNNARYFKNKLLKEV